MLLLVLASLLASGLGLGRLGGWEEQDPSLVKWKNMLENDLDTNLKLVKIKNIPYTITHVTSQLVSGMNYKFDLIVSGNKCELTYYVQPWTDTHQITQDTCGIKVTHRRDNVGGWENVDDLSDPGLQECLGQSLDRVNQEINSYFRTVETSILSAQKKIIAGALYRVKFNAAPSNKCTNSERFLGKTSTDCPVSPDNQIQESEWQASCSYQAWMNPSTIVKNVTMIHP